MRRPDSGPVTHQQVLDARLDISNRFHTEMSAVETRLREAAAAEMTELQAVCGRETRHLFGPVIQIGASMMACVLCGAPKSAPQADVEPSRSLQ